MKIKTIEVLFFFLLLSFRSYMKTVEDAQKKEEKICNLRAKEKSWWRFIINKGAIRWNYNRIHCSNRKRSEEREKKSSLLFAFGEIEKKNRNIWKWKMIKRTHTMGR